jgi:hypothetical protein
VRGNTPQCRPDTAWNWVSFVERFGGDNIAACGPHPQGAQSFNGWPPLQWPSLLRHCRCESTRSSVGVSLFMHVPFARLHACIQARVAATKHRSFLHDRSISYSISALMPWPDANLDLLAPPPHHPRCDAWPTAVRLPSGQDCEPSGGTFIVSTDEDVDNVRADCISINGSLDVGCVLALCRAQSDSHTPNQRSCT